MTRVRSLQSDGFGASVKEMWPNGPSAAWQNLGPEDECGTPRESTSARRKERRSATPRPETIRCAALHVSAPARYRRARQSLVFVDQPRLFRFVVLSMLLHLWIVVLFGTSTYSGARRDREFGDAFDVSLRALIEEHGSGFRLAPGADTVARCLPIFRLRL